ncbi:LAFE_0H11914g1_1 [Lachancea fermentati]|uniref:LAFE_0H11914g1_1 n=1 Tax=Lachancea fermentati TaxID=4955 RepID=A0A1G4MKP5_LACFM|nr:LAFE_0H11914g1_1 [Lachancea fermentati]
MSANRSAQQSTLSSFLEVARTSQFAWFIGHVVVLFSSALYLLTFRGGSSGFHNTLYRVMYLGVIESFSVIIDQQHLRSTNKTSPRDLLLDDNVLYLGVALLWIATPRLTITMVPYVVFSLFHFLTYLKSVLLPQVFHLSENSKILTLVDSFVRQNNDKSMNWSSFSELCCLIIVLLRALLWYPRSWIVAIIYSVFIKVRYEKSPYMKSCVKKWEVRLDGLVSHPKVFPQVKNIYMQFKSNIRQLGKYNLAGPSPATSAAKQN